MGRPSRFSPEVRERAVRLVMEQRPAHPSEWAARQTGLPQLRKLHNARQIAMWLVGLGSGASPIVGGEPRARRRLVAGEGFEPSTFGL